MEVKKPLNETQKTLIQCDFDGTVTKQDVSFILLDAFAGDWRKMHQDYEDNKITVGRFNQAVFARVRSDRETLLKLALSQVEIRPGFAEMVDYCRRRDFRFVIVSNGLDFYIDGILREIGLEDITVYAAETGFDPTGLKVLYVGPDGNTLDDDFKVAYADLFLSEGYRLAYIGNGISDFPPASRSQRVFAVDSLLERCRQEKLDSTPFSDFHQVINALESW